HHIPVSLHVAHHISAIKGTYPCFQNAFKSSRLIALFDASVPSTENPYGLFGNNTWFAVRSASENGSSFSCKTAVTRWLRMRSTSFASNAGCSVASESRSNPPPAFQLSADS